MKKAGIFSMLMLFFAVTFTSCETEPVDPVLNENNNNNNPGTGMFEVDIDGEPFVATTATANVINGGIAITGIKVSTGQTIMLVTTGTEEGEYPNAMQYYTLTTGGAQYINVDPENFEVTGSVVIEDINTVNHTISGTFSFTAWPAADGEPVELTNGIFENIPYTGDLNPNPIEGEYFRAKIDGTQTTFGLIQAMELGEQLALVGANAGSSIDIRVAADITPGTYEISDDFEGVTASYISLGEMNSYFGMSGTLTIISNGSASIKGTFEFTGLDMEDNTIEITDGEFNIEN